MPTRRLLIALSGVLAGAAMIAAAAPAATSATDTTDTTDITYRGLEISVSGVERAVNVSLSDCPAGANTVRGVIRPGDVNEFATVKVNFKVLPAFTPGPIPKPVLYDEAGKAFNTAQSFGDVGGTPSFSCTFSFRIPKGTKLKRFAIDTASIDLATIGQ
jgi:hypothetical protein